MKMTLDERTLKRFQREMDEREYSPDTKRKYTHTLEMLLEYAGGRVNGKGILIAFKSHLKGQGLAPSTINGAYMRMVITAIATECAHGESLSAAARNTGRAMRETGIPGELSFDGLPLYMKAFLVLLKCRLWPAAAALVRARMD